MECCTLRRILVSKIAHLSDLEAALIELQTEQTLQCGINVAHKIMAMLGVDDSSQKLMNHERLRKNKSWLKKDEDDRPSGYELGCDNDLPVDFKIYWVQKQTRQLTAQLVALTPNFEDDPAIYLDMNVGLDFIISPNAQKFTIVLAKEYGIRTLTLEGKLTNTQKLILDQWVHAWGKPKSDDKYAEQWKRNLHDLLWKTFDISEVNKQFYQGIAERFSALVKHLVDAGWKEDESKQFANRLIGRIIFCWFLDKKEMLNPEENYLDASGVDATEYYKDRLHKLFFGTLNTPIDKRHELKGQLLTSDRMTPFLNGGLFEEKPGDILDKKAKDVFPPQYFSTGDATKPGFYEFLRSYHFTTDENTADYQAVAIDPEMLGRIFENLLAEQLDETAKQARKAKGAFYTPREIVDYMCRESLRATLEELIDERDRETVLNYLLDLREHQASKWRDTHGDKKLKPYKRALLEKLDELKVLDPAVGSGAFPMGLLQLMLRVYERLDGRLHKYKTKLQIVKNNLYGVDIEPMAVEICRLRAWLSIMVDEELNAKKPNMGVKPLPNLEFKFICANSIFPLDSQRGTHDTVSEKELTKIRDDYFNARSFDRKAKLRKKYRSIIQYKDMFASKRQDQLQTYAPFDTQTSCSFFNSELMFGIATGEANEGFDIVVANPPYVGHKGGQKKLFNAIRKSSMGQRFNNERMDIFYYFIHLAIDLLSEGGVGTFITTNYFITADSAIKLRRDLQRRATVAAMTNFNEAKIFESAMGQHNVITQFRKGKNAESSCRIMSTNRKGYLGPTALTSVLSKTDPDTKYEEVPNSQLFEGDQLYMSRVNSVFAGSNLLESSLEILKKETQLLGDHFQVSQGIVTGLDRITQRHLNRLPDENLTKGDGCFVVTKSEAAASGILQEALVKPWFKNSDISKFHTNDNNSLYLIHISSETNLDSHPKIRKHLQKFKAAICSRNYDSGELSKAKRVGAWWALSSARWGFEFDSPKIVAPQRSYQNTFGYNEQAWYSSADVYFITKKTPKFKLKYLLGLLNSDLYFLWLYMKGKRKGEMLELYQKPLALVPLKSVVSKDQAKIIAVVDAILKSKQPVQGTKFEKDLNRLVFEIHGLEQGVCTEIERFRNEKVR